MLQVFSLYSPATPRFHSFVAIFSSVPIRQSSWSVYMARLVAGTDGRFHKSSYRFCRRQIQRHPEVCNGNRVELLQRRDDIQFLKGRWWWYSRIYCAAIFTLSGVWMRLCQVKSPLQERVWQYTCLLGWHGSHIWVCITFCKVQLGYSVTKSDYYY